MTTLNPPGARTRRRLAPSVDTAPLAKTVVYLWAVAASALSAAALASAVLYAGEPGSPAVDGAGVSIGSLLAASFLWLAYSRVGNRSR